MYGSKTFPFAYIRINTMFYTEIYVYNSRVVYLVHSEVLLLLLFFPLLSGASEESKAYLIFILFMQSIDPFLVKVIAIITGMLLESSIDSQKTVGWSVRKQYFPFPDSR